MQNSNKSLLKILLILLATLCFFANNHILTVSIPLYVNELNLSLSLIGYCTASMGLITILAKFITPMLIKKIKLKLLIIVDLALLSVVSLCLTKAKTAVAIFLLRTIFGAPFSLFPILNLIAVRKLSNTQEELVKNTSIIGMAMPLSLMLSTVSTETMLQHLSFEAVFTVAFFSCIASLLLYSLGFREAKVKASNNNIDTVNNQKKQIISKARFQSIFAVLKNKNLLFPIISFFFLGMVDMLQLTYFPLLATSVNKSYSFYFVVFALCMVSCQVIYKRLPINNQKKLLVGYSVLCVSLLLTSYFNPKLFYLLSITSAILFGLGYSLTETTTNTIVMTDSNNNQQSNSSLLVTISQLSICFGRTVGPWFASFFSDTPESLRLCFLITSVLFIIPILLSSCKLTKTN